MAKQQVWFYNFEYCHPGLLADYVKETTGIKHIIESIPNALSSNSNEHIPKPYASFRSKAVVAIYHQGGHSIGINVFPPHMFRTFEFCGSAGY